MYLSPCAGCEKCLCTLIIVIRVVFPGNTQKEIKLKSQLVCSCYLKESGRSSGIHYLNFTTSCFSAAVKSRRPPPTTFCNGIGWIGCSCALSCSLWRNILHQSYTLDLSSRQVSTESSFHNRTRSILHSLQSASLHLHFRIVTPAGFCTLPCKSIVFVVTVILVLGPTEAQHDALVDRYIMHAHPAMSPVLPLILSSQWLAGDQIGLNYPLRGDQRIVRRSTACVEIRI